MRLLTPRRALMALALALFAVEAGRPARAQYPYGYGYGYGPGYNVPVTPGFGATYGGSTFGSYGFGLNRTYTTFGLAVGTAPRVTVYPATLPPDVSPSSIGAGYRLPGGAAVRIPPVRPGIGGNLNGALPNAPLLPNVGVPRPR